MCRRRRSEREHPHVVDVAVDEVAPFVSSSTRSTPSEENTTVHQVVAGAGLRMILSVVTVPSSGGPPS